MVSQTKRAIKDLLIEGIIQQEMPFDKAGDIDLPTNNVDLPGIEMKKEIEGLYGDEQHRVKLTDIVKHIGDDPVLLAKVIPLFGSEMIIKDDIPPAPKPEPPETLSMF